jgi:hypothetical protein
MAKKPQTKQEDAVNVNLTPEEKPTQWALNMDPFSVTLPQLVLVIQALGIMVPNVIYESLPPNVRHMYYQVQQ